MTYRVALRKNDTGEVRMIDFAFQWEPESHFYLWSDGGNYSCDCNRALFWIRADGREPTDDEFASVKCGETRFTALYAELPDGSRTTLDDVN